MSCHLKIIQKEYLLHINYIFDTPMYINHELGPILDFFSYFEILCCPTHICLKIQRFRGSSIDGFPISFVPPQFL